MIDAETGKRVPIWVELDSNATTPGEHRAADPPGDAVRVRAPLHRRDAQAQGREPATSSRRPRASATTATTCPPRRRRSTTSASASTRSSARCARRRSSARTSTSPGTSPSPATSNIAERMLHIRDDAFAQLGDTNLADGVVQGTAPAFTVDSQRRERTRAAEIARRVTRHVHGPVLPDQRLRGAGGLRPRRERQPGPARHLHGQLRLHHPARRRRRSGRVARRAPSLYGHGLLGSADEVGSAARSGRSPRRTTSSSARPTRSASPRRTSRTRSGSSRTWASSPSSPTASSRGC